MMGMGKGVKNTKYSLEEAVSVVLMHSSLSCWRILAQYSIFKSSLT